MSATAMTSLLRRGFTTEQNGGWRRISVQSAGTRAKQMDVRMTTRELHVSCNGKKILGGRLHRPIRPGESTWTIEDGDKVTVLLVKAQSAKSEDVWSSLLEDEFKADPMTLMEMMKKLDLEKFQIENPGFDFSNAVLSKKYDSLPGM
ncbi:nudC domain-containing protein 2-like isoform X2 [Varroa destructor]|uniref:CS domain-containing protein n=1 Tax=Varroa destructor TaxID=109461 RepID=A0A7M7M364_VARDE|nr:nudC domain-containing protein 2-like isoform X2 [Varroa destructor]